MDDMDRMLCAALAVILAMLLFILALRGALTF